jgi:flavin reductase
LTKLRFANETAAQSAISNHRESSPAAFLAPPGPASYVCPMAISAPHSGGDGAAVADGAVSEERFRRVMASFATGVTVITTRVRGEVRGMTANAFMSGSLDPPLCVISVGVKARMHGFLMEAGHFGVNILGRGQESLIGHFAGQPVEGIEPKYEYAGGTPVFAHANATIAAKVVAQYACGDHSLFVGHIFALRQTENVSPIVLHVGRLASLHHSHEQTNWPTLDFW